MHYFKQKELTLNENNEKEITVITSKTNDILNVEFTLVEEEIQKSVKHLGKFQKAISEKIQ